MPSWLEKDGFKNSWFIIGFIVWIVMFLVATGDYKPNHSVNGADEFEMRAGDSY